MATQKQKHTQQAGESAALILPGTMTETSLTLPQDLKYEDWAEGMRQLDKLGSRRQWWIGDAIIFGEDKYGAAVRQTLDEIDMTPQSVDNIVRVCQAIPPARRRPSLKYSHHVVVYKLPEEEQQAWLERAEAEGWRVREFRDRLHGPPGARAKRKFGPTLDFRGFRHEPINEQGVVFLFGMVASDLGFLVEAVTTGYPDCTAKRQTKGGLLEQVNIEFEFEASGFRHHKHDPKYCDLLVCWENDWPDCPLEVIELKTAIQNLLGS